MDSKAPKGASKETLLQRLQARWQKVKYAGGPPIRDPHGHLGQFIAMRKGVTQVIDHSGETSVLLEALCTLAVQETSSILSWVCRKNDTGGFDTLADAGQLDFLEFLETQHCRLPVDTGPLDWVWREQTPLYNLPFPPGPLRKAWVQHAQPFNVRSMAVLPIHQDHQPWALWVLCDAAREAFTPDVQAILQGIARRVSETLEDWADILKTRVDNHQQMILGAALRSAQEGVVLTDADRQVIYINKSFTVLTGYTFDEISRTGLRQLQGPQTDQEVLNEIHHALGTNGFFSGLILNYRRDGQTFWNRLSIIPVHNADRRLTHYVGIQRDVTQELQTLDQLRFEACHDRLTNLGNRRALEDHVAVTLPRVQRLCSTLAICMIDLDHFKPINDLYGHEAGDHVLRVTARRLQSALRRSDYVCRLGGDEFVLLIEGYNTIEELEIILVKLEIFVQEPIALKNGVTVGIRLSMGVCLYQNETYGDFDTYLRYADHALYQAKNKKGQRSRYWEIFVPEDINRTSVSEHEQ